VWQVQQLLDGVPQIDDAHDTVARFVQG